MTRLSDADLEALRGEGVLLKRALFSPEKIRRVRETALALRPASMPHRKPSRRWLLTSPSDAFRKCFRSDVRRGLVFLSELARQGGFRDFAARYYGVEVQLDHIMSIESPRSDEAITPWHTDANFPADDLKPADRFTLKFFIYMNDVGPSNGAFSYVPRTHRLVTALREGINQRAIPHFWTGRFPELKKGLGLAEVAPWARKRLPPGEIDHFLAAARRTRDGEDGADEYFLSGPAGTLVIFDDRGLHRGGVPRSDERSVLRYNYIPTRYWREQFTSARYLLNMALKACLPRSIAANWGAGYIRR